MQVSLLHEHGLRDHSISSHSATRRVALSRYPEGHGCHARASNLGRFEVFTPGSMGGQTSPFASRLIEHAKPNRVRRPLQRTFYGLVRHLLLLSTSPHGDAVAVGYRSENEYLGRTYTSLTVCAHKRTGASFQLAVTGACPSLISRIRKQDACATNCYVPNSLVFVSLVW